MANRHTGLARAFCLSLILLMGSAALPQDKKKPQLKDFGSSLKRIKWDPEKKAAVEVKPKSDAQTASGDIEVVKVETSLVSSDVLVLDGKGNFVAGLTDKDFIITEDGRPQQVAMFSMGDDLKVPRSIVLIIDHSISQMAFLQNSVAAAGTLIDRLGPRDRMAIVTDDVELLQNFTSNKKALKDQLKLLLERSTQPFGSDLPPVRRRFGKSQQYSALMAVLKEAFHREDERPIVIFQTDGDQFIFLRNPLFVPTLLGHEGGGGQFETDPGRIEKLIAARRTEFSLQDIAVAAQQSRATIYGVVPGFEMLGRSPADQVKQLRAYEEQEIASAPAWIQKSTRDWIDQQLTPDRIRFSIDALSKQQLALTSVCSVSGGWAAFLERPSQAETIYSRIISDINQRYLVGYYPTNKEHDGKRRKVEVTVRDHPEYVVFGRRWYYAPAADR